MQIANRVLLQTPLIAPPACPPDSGAFDSRPDARGVSLAANVREVGEASEKGSVLQGGAELPRHVSFVYEPGAMDVRGYRDAATPSERKLAVVYRKRALFRKEESTIRVQGSQLTVENRRGQQAFLVDSIEQLFVGPSARSGKQALMLRAGGRDHTLIDELHDAAHGECIERLVEEFLSLKDQPGLGAGMRDRKSATRVLSDSPKLRIEVVEADEHDKGIAHLRARTKGPAWSMAFLFKFLMVHNTFLLGGLLAAFFHPALGVIGGLGIGSFWATLLMRTLLNRSQLLADDHTLVVQRGRFLTRKVDPISLQDIRQVEVRRSAVKVNGRHLYTVLALTSQGEVKAFPSLPRKEAQALGRALRRHIKAARRSLANKARVRVADDVVEPLEEGELSVPMQRDHR